MPRMLAAFAAMLIPAVALAAELGDYVGYTIATKKTVVGYVEDDGTYKDGFEGCNYGRKIVFEDQTYLVCNGYSYHYAYRPAAVLLVQSGTWVMIVGNQSFNMRK